MHDSSTTDITLEQIEIAQTMAIAHYCVGLPLAAIFAFGFGAGLFGLWLGKGYAYR
jgi:Na+-driven multidrug efflux pump